MCAFSSAHRPRCKGCVPNRVSTEFHTCHQQTGKLPLPATTARWAEDTKPGSVISGKGHPQSLLRMPTLIQKPAWSFHFLIYDTTPLCTL